MTMTCVYVCVNYSVPLLINLAVAFKIDNQIFADIHISIYLMKLESGEPHTHTQNVSHDCIVNTVRAHTHTHYFSSIYTLKYFPTDKPVTKSALTFFFNQTKSNRIRRPRQVVTLF